MNIFSRFFGSKESSDSETAALVANAAIEDPLSLQLLFPGTMKLDSQGVSKAMRSYDRSMAGGKCEVEPELSRDGQILGLAGWGPHVIKMVGFDCPMPAEVVEHCVAPAHYGQPLKQQARDHKAHLILYYAGHEESPLEQYVALAAMCGVLSRFGAFVVFNESAHTSFPAAALAGEGSRGKTMELLRTLPLGILYCGFVKHDVEDVPGVWMRTYGANLLNLPDLAVHAEGHHEGSRYFEMFNNILSYLQTSNASMAPGHTMQLGQDEYLRVRSPGDDESFLQSDGELLVAEIISADQINT